MDQISQIAPHCSHILFGESYRLPADLIGCDLEGAPIVPLKRQVEQPGQFLDLHCDNGQ